MSKGLAKEIAEKAGGHNSKCPFQLSLQVKLAKSEAMDSSPHVFTSLLSQRVLKMEEFFPETYRLDIRDERQAFFTLFDGERPLNRPGALEG